jgi:hypothetical protein
MFVLNRATEVSDTHTLSAAAKAPRSDQLTAATKSCDLRTPRYQIYTAVIVNGFHAEHTEGRSLCRGMPISAW